jgi:hypothetical protein
MRLRAVSNVGPMAFFGVPVGSWAISFSTEKQRNEAQSFALNLAIDRPTQVLEITIQSLVETNQLLSAVPKEKAWGSTEQGKDASLAV